MNFNRYSRLWPGLKKFVQRNSTILGVGVICGVSSNLFFEYIGDFVRCSGPSMEPLLKNNDILITERISKRIPMFERGDIVISQSPIDPKTMICKRITGMPGDKIHLKPQMNLLSGTKSTITLAKRENDIRFGTYNPNDDANDEQTYSQDDSAALLRSKTIIVPRGHLWLEGDNSENSMDSRHYGPVPMGLIQSRAFCRILPYEDFVLLKQGM